MAFDSDEKLTDTIIQFIEEQRPVYETLIDRYYQGRNLNIFFGRRPVIPSSSMPSIEVEVTGVTFGWFACRVQEENPSVEIDITIDNGNPEQAGRLEKKLVSLTTRILASPPHLRPRITGTRSHLYDALPKSVTYSKVDNGRVRVATISWEGKQLEYLANSLFDPALQIPKPLDFPLA